MQTKQGNMLRSLRAAESFLNDNAARLADVVNTGVRQELTDATTALAALVSDQSGHDLASQGATLNQRALRVTLIRDHMLPISRIARANLPQTPQIEPLRMPAGKPTAEILVAAATGMAKAALPYADVFIRAALPVDFIAQLEKAAQALLDSLNDREQSQGKRTGATTDLQAKLRDGRKIVHILDALVKSALKNEPGLLANWNAVKRVKLVPGRPPVTPTPTPTPP